MGKVTVKHYLNKSVKPRIEGVNELYPLYVQIIANRTNYRFKSSFPFYDGYLQESDLRQDYVIKILEKEKDKIEKIVSYIIDTNKFDLLTTETISKYSEYLWDVINRNFGILFEKECEVLIFPYPDILAHRNYREIKEVLEFTESEIEFKLSEDYGRCRIAIAAFYNSLLSNSIEGLNKLTVFDYLHGNGSPIVLEAIKMYHGIYGGDEEKEYLSILNEVNKLIFMK